MSHHQARRVRALVAPLCAIASLFISITSFAPANAAPPVLPAKDVARTLPRPALIPLIGNDFRLVFKDAYLVYAPPAGPGSGTLQIAAELNVLSYGADWTVAHPASTVFHLKLNSWSGFFWSVDTASRQVSVVSGGAFGAAMPGGSTAPLAATTVDVVGAPASPARFLLRFGDAYLVKPTGGAHPQIVASNIVLSYGNDWTITQDAARPWVYALKQAVWKDFSWKANLRRQRAYRVTDALNPCATDVRLKMDVAAAASLTGGPNDYDVFNCIWQADARPDGAPYPATSPLAAAPDDEVIGKDVATATTPAAVTQVVIRDAATNAEIAHSSPADLHGDYDIRFSAPAATRSVIFEVAKLDTGEVVYRSAARQLAHGDNPRDILLAGVGGETTGGIPFPTSANTGLFTRIGNVELADISAQGFAKFAGAAARWRDAPFGGRLQFFGAFTQNFYPNTGAGNYCYKVRVTPPSGPSFYVTDPVYKTRYLVKSDGHVQSQSVLAGPLTLGAVSNCYRLTPLSTSPEAGDPVGSVAAFWSYPDLLANWNTGARQGLHQVQLELYSVASGTQVALLANDNLTAETYLDNTPIELTFDQLAVSGGGPNLLVDKCAIANLMNGRILTVDFTARHPTGFLAAYALSATSNSGVAAWSVSDAYSAPAWSGATPPPFVGRTDAAPAFTKSGADFTGGPCAYVLNLSAWARTTNGFDLINYDHKQLFYYVQP